MLLEWVIMIKLKKVADEIEYNGVKGSLKEVLQKTKVDGNECL